MLALTWSRAGFVILRVGCAKGNHRANIVGTMVADWVAHFGCKTFHLKLGETQQIHNVALMKLSNHYERLKSAIGWIRFAPLTHGVRQSTVSQALLQRLLM